MSPADIALTSALLFFLACYVRAQVRADRCDTEAKALRFENVCLRHQNARLIRLVYPAPATKESDPDAR